MATPLTKPVRREVFAFSPADDLLRTHVVELHADHVRIREKRRRTYVVVPYTALLGFTPHPGRDVETRHFRLRAELAPEGVVYRERGARERYTLPHGVAFQRAVALAVADRNASKPRRRRKKRRGMSEL